MKKGTALFIGRFQPFHRGHAHAVRMLLKEYKRVIIAVGCGNRDSRNPFSFQERKEIIEATLGKRGRYKIIGIRDYKSDRRWYGEIMKRAKFDVVVTGNAHVARCFRQSDVIEPPFLDRKKYSSTAVRSGIRSGRWKSLVDAKAAKIIGGHYA